ncbi:MAG: hypothetical protein ACLRWQ_07000 [Flavonifractor plautii]
MWRNSPARGVKATGGRQAGVRRQRQADGGHRREPGIPATVWAPPSMWRSTAVYAGPHRHLRRGEARREARPSRR